VSESVEVATILPTDLVDSTRLATSLGPLRADELSEWDGRRLFLRSWSHTRLAMRCFKPTGRRR
jgi:hypothetical protein